MADSRFRAHLIGAGSAVVAGASVMVAVTASPPPAAHADAVAYLVSVTLRPGYNFAGADAALSYGHGICQKLVGGRTYGEVMADVKTDFRTPDDFHASYLIGQAANELCPASINALRSSAAGYRPPPP